MANKAPIPMRVGVRERFRRQVGTDMLTIGRFQDALAADMQALNQAAYWVKIGHEALTLLALEEFERPWWRKCFRRRGWAQARFDALRHDREAFHSGVRVSREIGAWLAGLGATIEAARSGMQETAPG